MHRPCCVRRCYLGIGVLLLCTSQIVGQFDTIPITPFSLGGAAIAARLGAESVLQNPAGLLGIEETQIELGFGDSFASVYNGWFSIGTRLLKTTVLNFAMPMVIVQHALTIENPIGQAEVIGGFQDLQTEAILSVASTMQPHLSVGLNAKYGIHQVHTHYANSTAIDLGIQHDDDTASVGIMLKNIGGKTSHWSTGRTETTPMSIGVGSKVSLPFGVTLFGDWLFFDQYNTFNLGFSGDVNPYFRILGGIADLGGRNDWRIGTALDLSGFVIRYAFSPQEALGMSHRVGVCFTAF